MVNNTYTTASLIEAELRAENVFSSDTIPSLSQVDNWIEEESKIIELRSNQIFGSTLVESEILDYDGSGLFHVPEVPIMTINNLEYNTHSLGLTPSFVSLEEGDDKNFVVYTAEGEIKFINGQNPINKITPLCGNRKIRLSYTHGFTTTPLDVQRLATLLVARRTIKSLVNSETNTEGGEIQVGTIKISDPSNFGLNYLRILDNEISSLYDDIGKTWKTYRLTRVYQ